MIRMLIAVPLSVVVGWYRYALGKQWQNQGDSHLLQNYGDGMDGAHPITVAPHMP